MNSHYQIPEPLDPHDVEWVDADDDEERSTMSIKDVSARIIPNRRLKQGQADVEFTFEVHRLFLQSVFDLITPFL